MHGQYAICSGGILRLQPMICSLGGAFLHLRKNKLTKRYDSLRCCYYSNIMNWNNLNKSYDNTLVQTNAKYDAPDDQCKGILAVVECTRL